MSDGAEGAGGTLLRPSQDSRVGWTLEFLIVTLFFIFQNSFFTFRGGS